MIAIFDFQIYSSSKNSSDVQGYRENKDEQQGPQKAAHDGEVFLRSQLVPVHLHTGE